MDGDVETGFTADAESTSTSKTMAAVLPLVLTAGPPRRTISEMPVLSEKAKGKRPESTGDKTAQDGGNSSKRRITRSNKSAILREDSAISGDEDDEERKPPLLTFRGARADYITGRGFRYVALIIIFP